MTPMLQQYFSAKEAVPDTILFFRLGDFFELFFEDAVDASRALDLTLTQRGTFRDKPIPMAGVPVSQIDVYVRRLLEKGFKVAMCDQIEEASKAKGIVKRGVTKVLSPGVRFDGESMEADRNNYLVAIATPHAKLTPVAAPNNAKEDDDRPLFGLVALDISTGDLRATQVRGKDALFDELNRLDPSEIVAAPEELELLEWLAGVHAHWCVGPARTGPGDSEPPQLSGPQELSQVMQRALQLTRDHLHAMRVARVDHIRPLTRYHAGRHLILDATTLRNLEIFQTTDGAKGKGTLFHFMQRARSGPGARTIRAWLRRPLLQPAQIINRQDAVQHLLEHEPDLDALRDVLGEIRDMERIVSRAVMGSAHPKDLAALRTSLATVPTVRTLIEGAKVRWLQAVHGRLDPVQELRELLESALEDNPPLNPADGGVIRPSYDREIGRLNKLKEDGTKWFVRYEAEQRERTKIPSLKVRYNKVFGYYIEVTRTHLEKVPEDYIRKQTISTGERYFTPELKEMEAQILNASGRLQQLESEIFRTLRDKAATFTTRIQGTARALGALDALSGLAVIAKEHDYVRPQIHEGPELEITEGRHPTMEQLLPGGEFVPNDIHLGGPHGRMMLITGPNMAGKSTVMRQLALITIMAQMGSWVPASSARVGLVDRVFTRVGASDSITTGRSTFMVEMVETAEILKYATTDSLILLDEIGRGTATFDGLSIAWAVTEDIHNRIQARTLFATHYHELCALTQSLPELRNAHVSVREWEESIIFLRRLMRGPMRRSYGVEVARLAGIQETVVKRARTILDDLEHGPRPNQTPSIAPGPGSSEPKQLNFFGEEEADPKWERIRELLGESSPDDMTPRDALDFLYQLKLELEED